MSLLWILVHVGIKSLVDTIDKQTNWDNELTFNDITSSSENSTQWKSQWQSIDHSRISTHTCWKHQRLCESKLCWTDPMKCQLTVF